MQASDMRTVTDRRLPPIDTRDWKRLETASFALG